jgi:hypothetical protein
MAIKMKKMNPNRYTALRLLLFSFVETSSDLLEQQHTPQLIIIFSSNAINKHIAGMTIVDFT